VLAIAALGFENFVQKHLDIYNKGTTVEDNIAAIRVLREIKRKYGNRFKFDNAAGLIIFDPWVTLDDLEINFKLLNKYRAWDWTNFPLSFSDLRCYRGSAIYEKIRQEDLIKDKRWQFVVPWKFKDKDVELAYKLILKVDSLVTKGMGNYKWSGVIKAELKAMKVIIDTIRKNRGVSEYLLWRLCLRNIRGIVEESRANLT
jgi:hypothetical protein